MACFISSKSCILLSTTAISWQQWKFCVASTLVVSQVTVLVQSFTLPVLQRSSINFHGLYETRWAPWNRVLLFKESALRQKGKQAAGFICQSHLRLDWNEKPIPQSERESTSFCSLTFLHDLSGFFYMHQWWVVLWAAFFNAFKTKSSYSN